MPMLIPYKICYKQKIWDRQVDSLATFGVLKEDAAQLIGIPAQYLTLHIRGRPVRDEVAILAQGMKPGTKLLVTETVAYRDMVSRSANGAGPGDGNVQNRGPAPPHQASVNPQRAPLPQAGSAMPPPQASTAGGGGVPGLSAADAEQAQMRRQIRVVREAVDGLTQKAEGVLQHAPDDEQRTTALRVGEMLTQQLLALDSIHVEGDARLERKAEINRINAMCDELEAYRKAA